MTPATQRCIVKRPAARRDDEGEHVNRSMPHRHPQLARRCRLLTAAAALALAACGSDAAGNPGPATTVLVVTSDTDPAVTETTVVETSVPTTVVATTSPPVTDPPPTVPAPVLPPEPMVLFEWYPAGEDRKSIIVSDESLAAPPVRVVPESAGAAVHSNWSHDGTRFTWEVLRDDDTASVWVADADGTNAVETVVCPSAPCVEMSYPSFSPDDARMLVTRYDLLDDGNWGPSHLVLADLTTGEQTIIASTADGTTSFYLADMSPDGSMVAATLETYSDGTQSVRTKSEIVVVDTDPSTSDAPIPVTDPALFAGYPSWHPTDDRILFASWDLDAYQGAEKSQLYTVASDGSALTQMTNVDYSSNGRRPGEARWTPDGQRIIAGVGVVEQGRVVDVKIAWVDPITGTIDETSASGAMPSLQP